MRYSEDRRGETAIIREDDPEGGILMEDDDDDADAVREGDAIHFDLNTIISDVKESDKCGGHLFQPSFNPPSLF
jgi:hypothetical protein